MKSLQSTKAELELRQQYKERIVELQRELRDEQRDITHQPGELARVSWINAADSMNAQDGTIRRLWLVFGDGSVANCDLAQVSVKVVGRTVSPRWRCPNCDDDDGHYSDGDASEALLRPNELFELEWTRTCKLPNCSGEFRMTWRGGELMWQPV